MRFSTCLRRLGIALSARKAGSLNSKGPMGSIFSDES